MNKINSIRPYFETFFFIYAALGIILSFVGVIDMVTHIDKYPFGRINGIIYHSKWTYLMNAFFDVLLRVLMIVSLVKEKDVLTLLLIVLILIKTVVIE